MLKLKYLYENYDLARFALKNWECDKETLNDCLQHFRISSNAVYPFLWHGTKPVKGTVKNVYPICANPSHL